MQGVTAKQIAELLGLSPSAVSLALNGKPGVSEATRAMVLSTAARMGYTRLEASPGSKTICFVRYAGTTIQIAEHTTFASFVLQGVEARATELGYGTQVRYLNAGDMFNPQILESLSSSNGIVFLGTDLTQAQLPELEHLLAALEKTPLVVVDSSLLCRRADCVINDGFGGAKAAGEYLLARGHRRMGYVQARQRIRNFLDREAGFREALAEAGAAAPVVIPVDISSEGAFRDFDAWLKGAACLPQALFAENDVLAAAAIRVLKKHGLGVPEDVSVMGFDDVPVCQMLDPPLTTVHAYKEELGAVAVDHLDRRVRRGEVPHAMTGVGLLKTSLSMTLIPRYSVSSPGD